MDQFLDGNSRNLTSQLFMERLSNPRFLVPDYVEDTLDTLYYDPNEEGAFDNYKRGINNRPINFQLFYARANLFFNAIKRDGRMDLFRYKPSIRKSVLYYTSHFKDLFIQLCTYNVN